MRDSDATSVVYMGYDDYGRNNNTNSSNASPQRPRTALVGS